MILPEMCSLCKQRLQRGPDVPGNGRGCRVDLSNKGLLHCLCPVKPASQVDKALPARGCRTKLLVRQSFYLMESDQ